MTAAHEVGLIFQCTLCGSFSIFSVDVLDPVEIELYAKTPAEGQKSAKVLLQKDLRAMELVFIERTQQRFGSASRGFVLLPCATCIELLEDVQYGAWLDAKENLSKLCPLCPHVAVTFEAGEACPAYVHKCGEWVLTQGVGPKDLEVKLPHRLPAGQFRMLLPPRTAAIRPPCWGTACNQRRSGGNAVEEEPAAVWDERREIIQAVVEVASRGLETSEHDNGPSGSKQKLVQVRGPPPVGVSLPWLEELLDAAKAAASESKKGSSHAAKDGANYVSAPLLSQSAAVHPLAHALLVAE